jgi:hypothetical protein
LYRHDIVGRYPEPSNISMSHEQAQSRRPGVPSTRLVEGQMALPKAQRSCGQLISSDGLARAARAHELVSIDRLDNPFSKVSELKKLIVIRGL